MTRAELAAKIKGKYPSYASLGDDELVEKVLAKYPQYGDQLTEPASPAPIQETPAPEAPQDSPPLADHWLTRLVKGGLKQAPLTAMDAAKMMMKPGQELALGITEALGFDDAAQRVRDQNALADVQMRAPFEATQDEGTAGAIGRGITKAAPQMGMAALTGGASVPAQAAILGAAGGAQALAEGDSPVAGALGGAVAPVVGPLAGKVVGAPAKALKGAAVRQFERALGATKEATKAEAARITPELLERGVSGSLKGLSKRAKEEVNDLGKQISEAYKTATQSGEKVDATNLAQALEKLKAPFQAIGETGETVALNPQAITAIDDLQQILVDLGPRTTPSTIWKFRKSVDDVVAGSNGFTRELPKGSQRAIQKKVRTILQDELAKKVPSVERLNSEFRLWKGLQDVADATLKRRTSQERNLIPAIIGGSSGGALLATGDIVGAGGAGIGSALLIQAIRSPLWRTTSAVTKNAIADILAGVEGASRTEAGRNALAFLAIAGAGVSREIDQSAETQPAMQ